MATRIDDWVRTHVTKELAAIAATGWDVPTQIRYVRLSIERGLDELEASENEYFDFMSQCAVLASENMQDARLQALEHQVSELQNPPFNLAATLLEGALIMVGELIIVECAYFAVPALFAVVASRKLAQLARTVTSQANAAATLKSTVGDIERGLYKNVYDLNEVGKKIRATAASPKTWSEAPPLLEAQRGIRREIVARREQLKVVKAALGTSEAAAAAASKAHDVARAGTKVMSAELEKHLMGVEASAIIGRIGETTGQDIAALSLELLSQATAPFVSFETSGIVGELLAALEAERRANRQAWSDLRFLVRFIPDDRFLDDVLIQDLQALIVAGRFETATPATFCSEDRSLFIIGFETLLWRHWLTYSNLLQVVPFDDRDPDGAHFEGEVFDGHLVKEHYKDDSIDGYGYFMSGDVYPGALSLNEELAKHLFNRFARSYFSRNPGSVPAPMPALDEADKFDKARYDELWAMPKSNLAGFANSTRAGRLDEVRILIIEYFVRTARAPEAGADGEAATAIRKAIRDMFDRLGEDPPPLSPLQKVLEELPTFPAPAAPAISQGDPGALTRLANALATAGGLQRKWMIGDARSQLEAAVVALDLKVTTYPASPSPDSSTSSAVARAAADDAAAVVEEQQAQVTTRYAELLELAADEPAVIADVQAQLGERIRALSSWTPDQTVAGTWQWYAPDDSPPVS